MKAQQAQAIIKKYHLIPGGISRRVLSAIINDIPYQKTFRQHISSSQYESLKKLYEIYSSKKLKTKERYAVFYSILEDKISDNPNQLTPRVENLRVSLLSLLLNKIDTGKDQELSRRHPELYQLSAKKIQALNDFVQVTHALSMDSFEMKLFINWLTKASQNVPSTIFIPICPDYSTEASKDPQFKVKHTFTSVGDGLGPVAIKILEVLPKLQQLLKSFSISPQLISGIADFEAFSKEGLHRLGLSEKNFLLNVEKSARLFEKKVALRL